MRAVVVGVGQGVGRQTVEMLIAKGHELWIADRDKDCLLGIGVPSEKCVELDLTNPTDRLELFDKLKYADGDVDALVINAGIHQTAPVERLLDTDFNRVLDVNFISHIQLVRDFIPLMAVGGRIIGMSSISAGIGMPTSAAYSASKAALERAYESLRLELMLKGLWSVLIRPGNINTGFNETGNRISPVPGPLTDLHKSVIDRIDSRHGMPPETVAAVIIKAVESRRPKACYIVGTNALKAEIARRVFGLDISLLLVRRFFGLR